MAYSTPLTAVSNATLTAAQWNASVRDNILETVPAKATAAGRLFVSTGANAIAERVPTAARVETGQTTGSGTYTDLATVGPAVTVVTGTRAIVIVTVSGTNSVVGSGARADFDVSGATTRAATDDTALLIEAGIANQAHRASAVTFLGSGGLSALTAGSNTFTVKYHVQTGGTGTFNDREILVIPL
jgi:hypothetical protein